MLHVVSLGGQHDTISAANFQLDVEEPLRIGTVDADHRAARPVVEL